MSGGSAAGSVRDGPSARDGPTGGRQSVGSRLVRGPRRRSRRPGRKVRPYRRRMICRVAPCARTPSGCPFRSLTLAATFAFPATVRLDPRQQGTPGLKCAHARACDRLPGPTRMQASAWTRSSAASPAAPPRAQGWQTTPPTDPYRLSSVLASTGGCAPRLSSARPLSARRSG